MRDLRALDLEKLREFHASFYRPENLTIFIAGRVAVEEIFETIEKIESKLSKSERPATEKRSRSSGAEKPAENVTKTIHYPSDEEDTGSVFIAWQGPNSVQQFADLVQCKIILKYLCSGLVSPLRAMVNEEFAGQIDVRIMEYHDALILLRVTGVELQEVSDVEEKVFGVFQKIVNETGLNMKRLRILIQLFWEHELNALETEPHIAVFKKLVPIFINPPENEVCNFIFN